MSCSTDTSKGHNKCLVKFDSYGELINYYNGQKENPSFFEKISPYLSVVGDYTNIFDPSFFNKFEPFDRLDAFIANPLYNNNKKTGYPVVDRLLIKGNETENNEGIITHKLKRQVFTIYGKDWPKCIRTALTPIKFKPDCDWEIDQTMNHRIGKKTMMPHVPDPDKKTKDVITALEFVTYPAGHPFAGCIAKLTGIYYADIFDVADKTKWNALVDGKINGDVPHYLDRFINPKERQSDITLAYDEVIGNKAVEKTSVFGQTLEAEMKGIDVTLENVYAPRKLLIVDDIDKGYALTGIKYITEGDGDTPIRQIECKFSTFYTRHLPQQYPDKYVSLVNGQVVKTNSTNISNPNSYEIRCENNEYIQSLMFMYTPHLDGNSPDIIAMVASFFSGKVIEGTRPSMNLGVMGILGSLKLKINNYNDMIGWIQNINDIRTCDMTQATLYEQDTIEYAYAKGILKQYLILGYPSDRCKVVLTDYCNKVDKIDEEDEFVSGGYENNVNMVETTETNDIVIPNGILISPNKKFALVQAVNGLLLIYKFQNPISSNTDINNPSIQKQTIWSSSFNQPRVGGYILKLTTNGDLVTSLNGNIIWSSNNQKDYRYKMNYDIKEGPYSVKMTNKGGLYIYDKNDEIIWSSQTQPGYNEAVNIKSKLCNGFCGLKDSNCDTGINTYCSKSKYFMDISGKPSPFKFEYFSDISGVNYYRKVGESFKKLAKNIYEDTKYTNIKLPKLNSIYNDNICACKVEYSDDIIKNIEKIREYYQRLLDLAIDEKINVADKKLYPNTSETSIKINIEKLDKDIKILKEFLIRMDLFYPLKTYDKTLSLKLKPDVYNDIKVNGKIRTHCSFPWCAKSNYKSFVMKQDEQSCNEHESCLGGGYTIYSTTDKGDRVLCNLAIGAEGYCTTPLEPLINVTVDPKKFLKCKTILNPDYEPKIEYTPSYCSLKTSSSAISSRGSWECRNITRDELSSTSFLSDISSLFTPKITDLSNVDLEALDISGIKYYYAKRGVYIPEFPLGEKGLCPPPWDDKVYVRTPVRCSGETKDCEIIGQKITSNVCEYNPFALETSMLKGRRKISYEVKKEEGNGIRCTERAKSNIDNNIDWAVETKDGKTYVTGYEKCVYNKSATSSNFFSSTAFKSIGLFIIFLIIIFFVLYKKRK
jgi:hypothetical protein